MTINRLSQSFLSIAALLVSSVAFLPIVSIAVSTSAQAKADAKAEAKTDAKTDAKSSLTKPGYDPTAPAAADKPAPDKKTSEDKATEKPADKVSDKTSDKADKADKVEKAAGKPLMLWEVKSATNTIYLYGTVHAGKADFYPLPNRVSKAFTDSKVLVVEADVSNVSVLRDVAPLMSFKPPETLESKLPKALFARFKALCDKYKIPIAQAQQFRPFMASSIVALSELEANGYEVRFGVDGHFLDQAKLFNKPIVELESVGEQIRLFSQFNDAESLVWFENALNALESDKSGKQVEGLMNAWLSGDAHQVLEITKQYNDGMKDAEKFDDRLVFNRHEAMMIKLNSYLAKKDEVHFVAVGTLHLPGPKGLVALLEKKGYKVSQLRSEEK
jgi:uncharacterized protein